MAVCEAIKRGLVAAGVKAEKVHVIYSGTDTDRFHPGVDGTAIRREPRFRQLPADVIIIIEHIEIAAARRADVLNLIAAKLPRTIKAFEADHIAHADLRPREAGGG